MSQPVKEAAQRLSEAISVLGQVPFVKGATNGLLEVCCASLAVFVDCLA